MTRLFRMLARDSRGATAIEYGLIMALVFLTMLVGFQFAASQTVGMLNNVSNAVNNSH